jgi:transposase
MYASAGRPSIPPEKLLRAQLLQMLYSSRSERLLMEEIDYSLLFRWFVGLNLDEAVWDATTFTKNRDRLLEAEVAKEFLAQVVAQARTKGLTSDEHFTVDGTLLEAWAGLKSFQRKDGKIPPPPDDPGNPSRSRRQAGTQRPGQGGQVELLREPAGGESQRADREQRSIRGQRYRGARRGAGDAGEDSGYEAASPFKSSDIHRANMSGGLRIIRLYLTFREPTRLTLPPSYGPDAVGRREISIAF